MVKSQYQNINVVFMLDQSPNYMKVISLADMLYKWSRNDYIQSQLWDTRNHLYLGVDCGLPKPPFKYGYHTEHYRTTLLCPNLIQTLLVESGPMCFLILQACRKNDRYLDNINRHNDVWRCFPITILLPVMWGRPRLRHDSFNINNTNTEHVRSSIFQYSRKITHSHWNGKAVTEKTPLHRVKHREIFAAANINLRSGQ